MFEFDFGHGDELELLRETVRGFAADRIAPLARDIDEKNEFPAELWPELGELGLLGITVEDTYGGSELGYLAHVIAMEEISRASASVGLSYGAHSNLCVNQLRRWGNEEQKKKYLPDLVSGATVGALAMSEAGAGSDVMGMRTTAVRDGDAYVLNGAKMWITNAPRSDVMVVYAKTDPEAGSSGVSAFLVEADSPGLEIRPIDGMLGFRASALAELGLDRCRLPADSLLGRSGLGFTWVANHALDLGRYTIAWASAGLSRACLDASLSYASEREQFGVPIKEHQLVRAMLADMWTEAEAAELLCANAGRLRQEGDPDSVVATATAKYFGARAASRAASSAVQIHGANGCSERFPVQRYFRDAKVLEIIEGSTQIQQLLISHSALARQGETS